MTPTIPLEVQAREHYCPQPFTASSLDALPFAHRAKPGEAVAAIRSFAVTDKTHEKTTDHHVPDFAVVMPDGPRFATVELHDAVLTNRPAAAIAYVAMRSDDRVESLAEKDAYRRKMESGDAFEVVGLRGALIITTSAFVFWPSERASSAHVPRILEDIRVVLSKGQSNHARLEAIEGAAHYLTHRLHRAFDDTRSSRPEDWPIQIALKS